MAADQLSARRALLSHRNCEEAHLPDESHRMKNIGEPDDRKGHVRFDEGEQGKALWISRVRLIEALVWKRRVNWLARKPVGIGSYLSLFSTLLQREMEPTPTLDKALTKILKV